MSLNEEWKPMEVPDWQCLFQETFYRNNQRYIGVRVNMLRESKDVAVVVAQIGRYSDEHKGTKFFVSLNEKEIEWSMEILPKIDRDLKNANELSINQVCYVMPHDDTEDRLLKIYGSIFENRKYLVFEKAVGTLAARKVDIPRTFIPKLINVMPKCLALVKLNTSFDVQMQYIDDIIKTLLLTMFTEIKAKVNVDDLDSETLDDLCVRKRETGIGIQVLRAMDIFKSGFAEHKSVIDKVLSSLGLELFNQSYAFDFTGLLDQVLTNFTIPNTVVSALVNDVYQKTIAKCD